MQSEDKTQTIKQVIDQVVDLYHFKVKLLNDQQVKAPFIYQKMEVGFRPYLTTSGKASAEYLQQVMDDLVKEAQEKNVDLGLESVYSVSKLAIQMGLGVDCSSFATRVMEELHQKLGLKPYAETVFRKADGIRNLYETKKTGVDARAGWAAKDAQGNIREMTQEENDKLYNSEYLSIDWVANTFNKEIPHMISSSSMSNDESSVAVDQKDAKVGDFISFTDPKGNVTHIGVIDEVEADDDSTKIYLWHSWHSRDFESGIRRDNLTISNYTTHWSHPGLGDPTRYSKYEFRRAKELYGESNE